jgi:hypothetical protein
MNKIIGKCLYCGGEIIARNIIQYYGRKRRKYCSLKCSGLDHPGHPAWNKGIKGFYHSGSYKKGHIGMIKESHPNWKGGKTFSEGYIRSSIKENKKYIHRDIMENCIGRKLERNEIVHHINGDKTDNRIENLKIMTRSEHIICHLWAK